MLIFLLLFLCHSSPPSLFIRHSSLVITSLFRHTPPSAYGLRPIASSSFFRLETPFLPFFALLYYSMNQLFIYPFYTNRPSFVHHSYILSISFLYPNPTLLIAFFRQNLSLSSSELLRFLPKTPTPFLNLSHLSEPSESLRDSPSFSN